jgi:hypothetical protein
VTAAKYLFLLHSSSQTKMEPDIMDLRRLGKLLPWNWRAGSPLSRAAA